MKKRQILCIDLKSFYASVECAKRNLDPHTTPLVVADKERGEGSIILAVSPYLREKGIPSRCRIYELDKTIPIIYAKPKMQTYIDYAIKVIEIYLNFISDEDLFIYSIDEAFLDVTSYLNYYNKTAEQLAEMILKTIKNKLKIEATCGIGPNMVMAKFALDIESKTVDNNIASWNQKDLKEKLWPITDLTKMWGIGTRTAKRLNLLQIFSIYDLANFDVAKLKKHFGIIGIELYNHANGRDRSLIQDQNQLTTINKSYSIGQSLFEDYNIKDAILIIKEMTEELTRRLRLNKKMCQVVKLSITYSKFFGGGFSRQMRLDNKTSNTTKIFKAYLLLLNKHAENKPIRKISISVTSLTTEKLYQISLFEDYQSEQIIEQLDKAIDEIKNIYGTKTVTKATSLLEKSTKLKRASQIGGHNA